MTRKLGNRSGRLERHATEIGEGRRYLLLGKQPRTCRTNGSRRLGLQRWRARKRIKREGKNQAGTSPRQALQTERATWNTCRQQRFPRAGKTGGEFRAWQRRKGEEKQKGKKWRRAAGPED